jgi:CheY-like chemotaxis protein
LRFSTVTAAIEHSGLAAASTSAYTGHISRAADQSLYNGNETTASQGDSMLATAPSTSATNAATILVVDDDEVVRNVIRALLEQAGYNVICAVNGADALALLGQMPRPAAILVDLFMPEMNGWKFANELQSRSDLERVPVIVVTGAGSHWGIPVPEDRFIRKPLDVGRLLKLLAELIGPASPAAG